MRGVFVPRDRWFRARVVSGGAGEDFGRGGGGKQFGTTRCRMRGSRDGHTCGLCEQGYHGRGCALGWACWKTCLGRPETDRFRIVAMRHLGNGLSAADH